MNKQSSIMIASLVLGVAIVMLGLSIESGMMSFAERERVVSVKGLAEQEVMADHVIWPIVHKAVGNNLAQLNGEIEQKNAKIIVFLRENGIDESEISLTAPEIIDMQAERYSNNQSPYRYNITTVLTVSSNKVDCVRQLMTQQNELLRQGIAITGGDYRYNTEFQFTKLNDVKPQMIQEATKNARAAAQKFAEDSDSRLGKIRTADQGLFTISNRDEYTPYIKKIRVVTRIDYYLND